MTIYGNSPHVYQVAAGFAMLDARDEIDAAFDVRPAAEAPFSPHIVTVRVGRDLTVAYDMLDGYNLPPERMGAAVASADLYFKRSFSHDLNSALPDDGRIRPFGLNYPVTYPAAVFRRMSATDGVVHRAGRAAKSLLGRAANPRVESFEAPPEPSERPKVVFMTGVYDPSGEPGEDPAAVRGDVAAERADLNKTRVAVVRMLRSELGDAFVGGLVPTGFARSSYPDCVLDPAQVSRSRFLSILKGADVGVATTGLHRSNQWKLAEYTAASRAILSQPPAYEVPAFHAPEHFLPFETPEECVARALSLLDDAERRGAMMRANHDYYSRYVRPDAIVRRTLRLATEPEVEPVTRTPIRLEQERARTSR